MKPTSKPPTSPLASQKIDPLIIEPIPEEQLGEMAKDTHFIEEMKQGIKELEAQSQRVHQIFRDLT